MSHSLHHSFDIILAQKYGIHEAILIHHFQHWIYLNKRLKKNFKEGRTWTFQTRKEIVSRFPYMTDKEVRGAIQRLIEKKVLVKGNFNKTQFDRTTWYAFFDESQFSNNVYDIPKGPMENDKRANLYQIPKQDTSSSPTSSSSRGSSKKHSFSQEEEEVFLERMKKMSPESRPKYISPQYKRKVIESIKEEVEKKKKKSEEKKRSTQTYEKNKKIASLLIQDSLKNPKDHPKNMKVENDSLLYTKINKLYDTEFTFSLPFCRESFSLALEADYLEMGLQKGRLSSILKESQDER